MRGVGKHRRRQLDQVRVATRPWPMPLPAKRLIDPQYYLPPSCQCHQRPAPSADDELREHRLGPPRAYNRLVHRLAIAPTSYSPSAADELGRVKRSLVCPSDA